ncbi:MAG TPA: preprotein translocase subunit SecE [Saprospiraceae bacterium]|nr:preprotein translocase subunit SecE [Saprospiraceae bacterium]HMP14062.1 preprotein translocase subunit SecE [Saprospiraceae bacterium]
MERLKLYLRESYNELVHKVTWPSWTNLQSSSIVVLVASLIFALIIFAMDAISNGLMSQIYGLSN